RARPPPSTRRARAFVRARARECGGGRPPSSAGDRSTVRATTPHRAITSITDVESGIAARWAATPVPRRAPRDFRSPRSAARERECEEESRALALFALHRDVAAVRGHDALRDREPEPGAAFLGAAAPVAVEDVRQLGRRDA